MVKRYLDEVSPEYVANYDDTYGAKYGVLPEVTVTPKGVPNIIRPKLNEQQWQKYWGDEGAARVSRGMNQAAPIVNDALMLALSGPGAPVSLAFEPLGILGGKALNAALKIKPVKNIINGIKFSKPYKLWQRTKFSNPIIDNNWKSYVNAMDNINYNIAKNKTSFTLRVPNQTEKEAFVKAYKRVTPTSDKILEYAVPVLSDEKTDILLHNPEYYTYLTENSNPPLFSSQKVNDFINRQLSSIRGVTAKDIQEASEFLTTAEKNRPAYGGDMLNTKGGLYTSNREALAEKFKNPVGETANGYVGKLKENFTVDTSKSINEQLKQLRNRIYTKNNPLYGTVYESNMYPLKNDVVAIEGDYGAAVQRAYLPKSNGKYKPVSIEEIKEYLAQTDEHGRWLGDFTSRTGDEQFFIPKELNRYDDFISFARGFLKPRKIYDTKQLSAIRNELLRTSNNRASNYAHKINNINNALDKIYDYKRKAVLPLMVADELAAGFLVVNNIHNKNKKFDKHLENIWNSKDKGLIHYDDKGNAILTEKGIKYARPNGQLIKDINIYNNWKRKLKMEQ